MNEDVNGLALDGAGNIIVVGGTPSNAGIASVGAHQTALSGTDRDGFIIKFNGTGGRLWGTWCCREPMWPGVCAMQRTTSS
ncbi:MAG: hypothetical protein IPN62_17715 [Flavobacteriales bacterium]|nr:hypothetical protein [Flavobacteriales bacterium]